MFSCLTCQPALGELGASRGVSCRRQAITKPELKKPADSGLFCVLLDYNSNHDNGTDESSHCFSRFQWHTRWLPIVSGMQRCVNGNMFQWLRFRGQVFQNTGVENLPNGLPERLYFFLFFAFKTKPWLLYLCLFHATCRSLLCWKQDLVYVNLPFANCTFSMSSGKTLWVSTVGELRQNKPKQHIDGKVLAGEEKQNRTYLFVFDLL